MAAADMMLVYNPHNTGEIWRVSGNTRRHIQIDEYSFYHGYLGEGVATISAQWFDSIPVATG
jgi:hypothetical protein